MAKRPHSSQHSFGWEAYFNRGLFANHFLEHRLPELPEWRETDGLEEAFKALQNRYRQHAARFSSRTNEAQTEHDFIQPVLDILWRDREPGDCYKVQVRIPNIDEDRQPDYAFFRTAADAESAAPKVGTMEFWQQRALPGRRQEMERFPRPRPGIAREPHGSDLQLPLSFACSLGHLD